MVLRRADGSFRFLLALFFRPRPFCTFSLAISSFWLTGTGSSANSTSLNFSPYDSERLSDGDRLSSDRWKALSMQWIQGKGLRREILGNLIIVSLFAFFLTGIGSGSSMENRCSSRAFSAGPFFSTPQGRNRTLLERSSRREYLRRAF